MGNYVHFTDYTARVLAIAQGIQLIKSFFAFENFDFE